MSSHTPAKLPVGQEGDELRENGTAQVHALLSAATTGQFLPEWKIKSRQAKIAVKLLHRWHFRDAANAIAGHYCRDDLSAEEAWRIYTLLTKAEAAFRTLKSPLAERPIFHHKECRVEAHIFLCVLAYHLLMAIEKTLLDAGVHTSWATVREQLKTHQVNTIVLPTGDGMELRIRKATTPEPTHEELYQKLGIATEIMRLRRSLGLAVDISK